MLAQKSRLFSADVEHKRQEHRLHGDGTRRHLFTEFIEEQALVRGVLVDQVRLVPDLEDEIGIE